MPPGVTRLRTVKISGRNYKIRGINNDAARAFRQAVKCARSKKPKTKTKTPQIRGCIDADQKEFHPCTKCEYKYLSQDCEMYRSIYEFKVKFIPKSKRIKKTKTPPVKELRAAIAKAMQGMEFQGKTPARLDDQVVGE